MKAINLLLICTFSLLNQDSLFNEFIKLFPKVSYDENGTYLTRYLNSHSVVNLKNNYTIIPDRLSLNNLVDGDSSRLFYKSRFYNVDEDRYLESIEHNNFYAIKSIVAPQYKLVIYANFYLENKYFYLKSFDKEGHPNGMQLINEVIYASAIADYSYKYTLFTEGGFRIFSYKKNNDNDHEEMKTKVVISCYEIDKRGFFKLSLKDSTYLGGSINQYSKFDSEPEVDDPVYKYWTLR